MDADGLPAIGVSLHDPIFAFVHDSLWATAELIRRDLLSGVMRTLRPEGQQKPR